MVGSLPRKEDLKFEETCVGLEKNWRGLFRGGNLGVPGQ